MAVQADEAAPAVAPVRRKRRGQLGWVGGIAVTGAALAALYLVMAPLLALLATAFRGPSDLLPFEPGAHWTFANLAEVYLGTNLLTTTLPNTAIFVGGSVVVTFFTAFTLAMNLQRYLVAGKGARGQEISKVELLIKRIDVVTILIKIEVANGG